MYSVVTLDWLLKNFDSIRSGYLQHNRSGESRICITAWDSSKFRVRSYRTLYFEKALIEPFSRQFFAKFDEYDVLNARYYNLPF